MAINFLKPGEKITSDDGKREFIIDSLINSGSGQGDIYKVRSGKDLFALKLFHTGNQDDLKKQIDILKKRGRASSAFVHPLYTVKTNDRFGYIMEYVGSEFYSNASILFNGEAKKTQDGKIIRYELPFYKKIGILYNICEAISILFEAGIALTDLKFENIKINKNDNSIKILDTDTAVGGTAKPIVNGTIGFMEPRVMKGEIPPNKYSDAFSLAVMIWMTLISGHPLRGRKYEEKCSIDIDTYTFATNPIYVYNKNNASNRPLPTDKRVIERMKNYPEYFTEAMHKTFVDGLFEGEKRVTPHEWQEILVRLYDDHFICKQCGEEHFLGNGSNICYICGTKIDSPISIYCEGSKSKGKYLFNGDEIWSVDILDEIDDYQLFKIVVSDYDKKYGLMYYGGQSAILVLKNGFKKSFERGEVIPIFLDSEIIIGKYKIKFR